MPRRRVQLRSILLLALSAGIFAYAIADQRDERERRELPSEPPAQPGEPARLRIVSVKPVKLAPGGAVVVQVAGAEDAGNLAWHAEVDKQPAEILHRTGSRLVVRVPADAAQGQARLRVRLGDRHTKPWVLTLRRLPRLTMLREILGGLALLVLGLRTIGRALRSYAGRRARDVLARLTQSSGRAALAGTLLGLLAQSTTSAAGLLMGLLSARMLALGPALSVLVGVQVGVTGAAVLLPFAATDQALWLVSLGVVWVVLANSRLSRSLGMLILGAGILFLGLGLLQSGYGPLLSDPEVLPYLAQLRRSQLSFAIVCVSSGALLTALFQGPAPLFALVMSLAQSSGILTLQEALMVLAGSYLGSVAGTAATAWPLGQDTRKLALTQLWLALPMTLLAALGNPLWSSTAERLLGGHVHEAEYRAGILYPGLARHLSLGFLLMSVAVALLGLGLAPSFLRLRMPGSARAQKSSPSATAATDALGLALAACRQALAALREVTHTADRAASSRAEQALQSANQALRTAMQGAGTAGHDNSMLQSASVACLHLVSAVDHALRIAEQAPEQGLSPSPQAANLLQQMQDQLDVGLREVSDGLAAPGSYSRAQAQAREIELNAQEAAARRVLFDDRAPADDSLALRLWVSELCAAYEAVGNHMYRIAYGLAGPGDDELG